MTLLLAFAALIPWPQAGSVQVDVTRPDSFLNRGLNPDLNPDLDPGAGHLAYDDVLCPGAEHPLGDERFWYSERGEWSFDESVKDDGIGNPVPDSGPCLTFKSTQAYRPRVRSPHSLAILRGSYLEGPYAFEVEAMQTGIETPHRDLVLVFGFQSPEQFFYAHLGMVPDATSSNVFEVNESPRRRIGEIGSKEIQWGRGVWHRLRVECNGQGHARVFVDDMASPHFEVDLSRPASGQIGFGSFDDAGAFRNLKVWTEAEHPNLQDMAGARSGLVRHAWGTNPFGGIAASTPGSPPVAHVQIHAGKNPLFAALVDVDGDGVFSAPADRWTPSDVSPARDVDPESMLPLTEAAITVDRIAVQPLLGPEGMLEAPYRFRTSIPTVSYEEYLKTSYKLHSQGHAPVGPWTWSTDHDVRAKNGRPTLWAMTPSDQPESWRWDAELFSDRAVMERLAKDFTLRRRDTGPKRMGSPLVPFDVALTKADVSRKPMLAMYNELGQLLGQTTEIASPEALSSWLDETLQAKPLDIRFYDCGRFYPPQFR
ncbi:hypothetical protein Poly30_56350 [Planctomycetes bacterium Poly30]|uniref:Uncharacterized protein n=1 Tax=Saltatorellus ferox TaxID=2528018 RepID=A0A518F159_9BACT|nr:hypothetical protein Poly30_56350 [Planctomycetes bacterium Poly30]